MIHAQQRLTACQRLILFLMKEPAKLVQGAVTELSIWGHLTKERSNESSTLRNTGQHPTKQ